MAEEKSSHAPKHVGNTTRYIVISRVVSSTTVAKGSGMKSKNRNGGMIESANR